MNRIISLVAVSMLAALPSVTATTESAMACFLAAEELNDIPSVNEPHAQFLEAYNATCRKSNLCSFDLDESLLASVRGTANPADLTDAAFSAPIAVKTTMDFGGSFAKDRTVEEYERACRKAGGKMGCIDGALYLDGSINSALAAGNDDQGDIVVDIELFAKSFPYCFPSECEGEDLTPVLEDAVRDAVLKVPEVKANLNPTTEALLKDVTFAQVCALSGLPTCSLSVSQTECHFGSFGSSSGSKAGYAVTFLIVAASTFFSIF